MKSQPFELLRDEHIPELNGRARLYLHPQSGAQLLSIENSDENKVFGISFRTPPSDSTGVAHIMEHSVLCGSRKYPLKEPFVELIKGSLNTFLNAFTYPDRTCYPVASQNLQDFYNLIDVYLDAVFYPLIPEHTLQQEGWHYEVDEAAGVLTYKGVVFNEMKGVYSSPDSLLARNTQWSLFPDTPYGVDSGGNPEHIPNLSYAQFKRFHETYYHPSNALIYFYGDDDPQARLDLMEPWLREFSARPDGVEVALQPTFSQPVTRRAPYPAGEGEAARKFYLTHNWMLGEIDDPQTDLGLGVLNHILLGSPAAPLRKALVDSGLGEDLAGGGLQGELRQAFFSTGLKGIQGADVEEKLARTRRLILDTLRDLAEHGIDPETVAASLNTVEFALRENNTGSFPRGLLVMLSALPAWLYGRDLFAGLRFEAPLAAIKASLARGEPYFENLLRKIFLENSHQTTVILEPDPGLAAQRAAGEQQRLQAAATNFNADQLGELAAAARRLQELQQAPDSPEALASLPSLKLSDLDRQIRRVPTEPLELAGVPLLYHDLPTNGIVYLDLGLDLHTLPQEDLPYVGLFGRALFETGAGEQDFVRFTQRIGRSTGGVRAGPLTASRSGSETAAAWLLVRGKALLDQAPELLGIIYDALLTARLDNRARFRQMVLEEKADMEAALVPAGHRLANGRLKARFTEADWAAEQMGGLSSLFFLRDLERLVDDDWPAVQARLERMRDTLLNRRAMLANVTLDAAGWAVLQPQLTAFLERLPAAEVHTQTWQRERITANEGFAIPAQVNYVGKGAGLYELGYELDGSIAVINNYLSATWLWERVRVQGGAYGGFSTFDHHSGVYTFLSYRDPNVLETLNNYDAAARFLRELQLDESELTKSIIGAIGDLDAYQLPDAKGFSALVRRLTGDTDEKRQRRRDQVLDASLEDFHALGAALERLNQYGALVVLGARPALEASGLDLQIRDVL